MKRVLIPVDGSECALRAVALVISKRAHYAKPEDLDIHLVNVQAPLSHDISRFASHEQLAGFHRDESEKALFEARRLLDAAGVNFSAHCLVGRVGETITALADSLHCDQIVMGTHGRGALKELLMGSVTAQVVQHARMPILLVK